MSRAYIDLTNQFHSAKIYTFVMGKSVDAIANEPMRLCACFLLLIPILVLFAVFHDKLLSNVTLGGVKE